MKNKKIGIILLTLTLGLGVITGCGTTESDAASSETDYSKPVEITNVSYDPTRELYEAYNPVFAKYWQEKTGQDVTVIQSHGGSGKQARSVIEGNEADVVTLAVGSDITAMEQAGLIDSGWLEEFDNNSAPYTSTIVFLVRKGNPKGILDWGDLTKEGVGVITPNPKTSGGARWNYLAAWSYADKLYSGEEAKIKEYVKALYGNVLVLDSGARGATTTFAENGQGDVLLAWENEAFLAMKESPDDFEIITPGSSILAQPSVAIVDEVVDERGTKEVATDYLEYLYSDDAQRLAGENFYRPSNPAILQEFSNTFDLNVNLVNIDDPMFGGWDKAQVTHFSDGGVFDEIYAK